MSGALRWWRRWTALTTVGELAGFAVPATCGALATAGGWPSAVTLPAVLAAGFAEGCALGYAQGRGWRSRLPALPIGRYSVATGIAAVFAYALGLLPSTVDGLPPAILATAGLALLASIGTAQWFVLRRAGFDRPVWIVMTAAAWLAGLAVFLLTAMPLWQPGQAWWLIAVIGVGCGLLMAFTVAALTGLAALRLLRQLGKGVNSHGDLVRPYPAQ